MNKFKLLTVVTLFCTLVSSASYALENDHTIKGVGANDCSVFSEFFYLPEKTAEHPYREWAYGYASALNTINKNNKAQVRNLRFLTGDLVTQEILAYCADKPDETSIMPVMQLIYDSLPLEADKN